MKIYRRSLWDSLSVTNRLIIFNCIIFIVLAIVGAVIGLENIYKYLALKPSLVLGGFSVWTIFTSMFLHAGFFHIFANMFSLFFMGNFLERLIGGKRLFWVYIASGILGSLFYIFSAMMFGGLNVFAVGASGAIFGLLGVLAVLVPYNKIYLIVGPLVLIVVQVLLEVILPANFFGAINIIFNILFILMLFSLFSFNPFFRKIAMPVSLPMWCLPIVAIVPLSIIGFFLPLPIGNSAHLGGLVLGLIYGLYLKIKFPNKTKLLSKTFR